MDLHFVKAIILCFVLEVLFDHNITDAAVASFSDDRCKTDGVCPSDPLTFTCEINGALSLRVELPNSHDDTVTLKNGPEDVDLPDGFTAVTLSIIEITDSSRNFTLTLSIAEASLLAGGEIRCDDTTPNNVAMAGCPIMASPTPSNLTQLLSSNTPTNATITWDSVDNAVSYNVSTSLRSRETRIEEESYTLTGLELETDYTVSVTATNECGVESPPVDITVRIDIQAPEAPSLADPLIDCSDNDKTMALVELSWTYGESRPTTASGLVDAPLTGVEVSYRDDDGSSENACVGVSDAMCTCGSITFTDTSCALYLSLRDGLQYETDDDVTVVVKVSNGKTNESEIILNAQLLDVKDDLEAVAPSVTLTLNQYCRNDYTVLITFGVRSDDDACEGKLNVTREIEPNTPETIAVDTNAIKLEDNQEYCYTDMDSKGDDGNGGGGGASSSGLSNEEIGGVSAGAVIGGGGVTILAVFIVYKKKNKKTKSDDQEMNIVSPKPSAAESGEGGATYQDPNTITRTPHPSTGEVYTDVSLDKKTKKKKTTEQTEAGPTYQDPSTIEHQEAPSGVLYAMPQQGKKGKKGKKEKKEEEELTEEQKAALYSVPDRKGQKAKSEGLTYAELSLPSNSQAPPSKGSTYADIKPHN